MSIFVWFIFLYGVSQVSQQLPYCSTVSDVLNSYMHGNRILSPNPKFIPSDIKQSDYFNEEILEKVNNKYYTQTEFNNALNELSISDMRIKPKIIGISESRLQKSKQHINNISLPNYVYEHTPTESNKGCTLLYLNKNLKYKLTRISIHHQQTIFDFLDNHLLPLLEEVMGDFNINLLNYGGKITANFLDTMFSYSYLPFINTPTRVTGHSKTLIDNIFYNKPILNITAGNINSVISDHLIQFFTEPSSSNAKFEQTCKPRRCYKNFDKAKLKNDPQKMNWKEHCSNPD